MTISRFIPGSDENGAANAGIVGAAAIGISQRMLSLTLRQLQQDGLITRTAYAEVPPRVEYTLAPLGRGLHEIVTSLVVWAADHHDEIRANRDRAATGGAV